MIIKEHKSPDGKTTVAVCDTELLGEVFEEGDLILDLSSEFYKGTEIEAKDAGDLLRNADAVNIVGAKSIKVALDEEIIDAENVKEINGIPYAQAAIMHE